MPPALWSESYRVGHDGLDDLHRLLVNQLEDIQDAARRQAARPHVLGLLDKWLDLFAAHAHLEERLMAGLRLPAGVAHRERHMAEHVEFLHVAMRVRGRYAQGGDAAEALDELGARLVASELIRRDFEMIGLLLREGVTLDP